MSDLSLVTYCGLYCDLCSQRNELPKAADDLREIMQNEEWDQFGQYENPQFNEFWSVLNWLVESKNKWSCRNDQCGSPHCEIRKCVKGKTIDACPFCEEYPCDKIQEIAKKNSMVITDGMRMKQLGIEEWIKEQKERKANGFSAYDIKFGIKDSLD